MPVLVLAIAYRSQADVRAAAADEGRGSPARRASRDHARRVLHVGDEHEHRGDQRGAATSASMSAARQLGHSAHRGGQREHERGGDQEDDEHEQ
jgi:homoserine acetyltransferase